MNGWKIRTCVVGMISTNCYLVYRDEAGTGPEETRPGVIIDPGDNAAYVEHQCLQLRIQPQAILLTHGHFDHLLAAGELREHFQIPIYAGEAEMGMLRDPDLNLSPMAGDPVSLTADRWLRNKEMVSLLSADWKVLHTPGHTAGSVCYYIEEEGLLFSGDTLFYESYGRTDLPTGSSSAIINSLTEVVFALPEETWVWPGHGETTRIGHEKKYNPAARFA